ncbi:hypothetical protein ACFV9E_11695 [Streptomyces sp. NPDC059835]|uniref:hypothetical protein n=1 Tax=Streptomyces sp. NPDC059835 TaxID=3346967 RepID=UPI0036581012
MTKKVDLLDEMPELQEAVDAVCEEAPSDARRRQIRAHARELVRALQHPGHPHGVGDDLADIFDPESLKAYEKLALEGELRDRGEKRPTSEATAMVRSGVMALLQRELASRFTTCASSRSSPARSRSTWPGASSCAKAW